MTGKKPDPEQIGRIWDEGLAAWEELCAAAQPAAAANQPAAAEQPTGANQPAGAHPAAGVPEEILRKAERCFRQADELGHMKAGRYLAVIDLMRAAGRGDITSKLILGTLYEFGYALPCDARKAERCYMSALADNHPNREGFMLAAGADLGMGRILALEGDADGARDHLRSAQEGGEPYIRLVAGHWASSGDL